MIYDEEDDGKSDQSDSDDTSEDDDDDDVNVVLPGDIIWELHGRHWYPGRACDIAQVPSAIRHKFKNCSS